MKALGSAAIIIAAGVMLALLACIFYFVYGAVLNHNLSPFSYSSTIPGAYNPSTTIAYQFTNTMQNTTHNGQYNYTTSGVSYSSNQLISYALNLINTVRFQSGLQNVTLSNVTSGQQHADSMLSYGFFSHWDTYGMKPYMRYTLLGGRGDVDENVAYERSITETCLGTLCNVSQINVTQSILDMESNMLYNDSACCNNLHRYDILSPSHNEVSLGIAFNKTTVYFVEDFINNYIDWQQNTPSVSGYDVSLDGVDMANTPLYAVQLSYEPLPVKHDNRAAQRHARLRRWPDCRRGGLRPVSLQEPYKHTCRYLQRERQLL